jgi:pimeloyl-ACP methyl ester carboxylesterase
MEIFSPRSGEASVVRAIKRLYTSIEQKARENSEVFEAFSKPQLLGKALLSADYADLLSYRFCITRIFRNLEYFFDKHPPILALNRPGLYFLIMGYNHLMAEISTFVPWLSLAAFGRELASPKRGERLFYYDVPGLGSKAGSDKRIIILIHGLGDEADSWRYLIPLLSGEGHRVLALDLPGFGRSVYRGRVNLRRHREAVLDLLEFCARPERPAVLAGNSMGALVAEGAAFTRPDLVKALVLIDGCFPMKGKLPPGLVFQGIPFVGRGSYRSLRGKPEEAYGSLLPYYFNIEALAKGDREFLRERIMARVKSRSQENAYFNSLRSLIWANRASASDYGKKLAAWPGKVFLVWGAEDLILPPAAADQVRRLRPEAGFSLIQEAGHLPHQEKPQAVAERMLEFIASA